MFTALLLSLAISILNERIILHVIWTLELLALCYENSIMTKKILTRSGRRK